MHVSSQRVSVQELIDSVKNAIRYTGLAVTSEGRKLQIRTVGLRLQTVIEHSDGVGLQFSVPVVGWTAGVDASREAVTTQTLELAFEPVVPPLLMRGAVTVEQALVDGINALKGALQYAQIGDNPWNLLSGRVELEFVVTLQGSISLVVDRNKSQEGTQKLSLEIGPVSPSL